MIRKILVLTMILFATTVFAEPLKTVSSTTGNACLAVSNSSDKPIDVYVRGSKWIENIPPYKTRAKCRPFELQIIIKACYTDDPKVCEKTVWEPSLIPIKTEAYFSYTECDGWDVSLE
jgi:hypothetical protein